MEECRGKPSPSKGGPPPAAPSENSSADTSPSENNSLVTPPRKNVSAAAASSVKPKNTGDELTEKQAKCYYQTWDKFSTLHTGDGANQIQLKGHPLSLAAKEGLNLPERMQFATILGCLLQAEIQRVDGEGDEVVGG